jgi:hypothetical protein
MIAGTSAWVFLVSSLAWFYGIFLTLMSFLAAHEFIDIGIFFFCILLTGSILNSLLRSRSEIGLDDTQDFFTEAIQFRRSEQRRLDVLSLIQRGRKLQARRTINTPESRQRERLQADLSKEKELETQLTLLRQGTPVDISESWRFHRQTHAPTLLYEKVQNATLDPTRKRLSFSVDFPELKEEELKDDTSVLRLNRQIYDFFQSLLAEPWLKPYAVFYESIFLVCRAASTDLTGAQVLYPFLKIGIRTADVHKLEGSYFNPRKLSDIAKLVFKNGAQV